MRFLKAFCRSLDGTIRNRFAPWHGSPGGASVAGCICFDCLAASLRLRDDGLSLQVRWLVSWLLKMEPKVLLRRASRSYDRLAGVLLSELTFTYSAKAVGLWCWVVG